MSSVNTIFSHYPQTTPGTAGPQTLSHNVATQNQMECNLKIIISQLMNLGYTEVSEREIELKILN